ncbi:MAG: DUF4882 family protein, partial [Acinetobacter baumannii]
QTNSLNKAKMNSTSYEGDFLLPNKGIVAFEMELKVPTLSSSTSPYSADISFNGITDNNYTIRSNYHFNIDERYQFKLPGTLQKVAFSMNGNLNILSTNLFGQELYNELITDRNALQFSYPQGTTDMCGNAI